MNLEDVFGVSNTQVESYIERKEVDDKFKKGLQSNKHLVIYGASKQGKTALTSTHMPEGNYIKIECSPDSKVIDLYKSLLRQLNIDFQIKQDITEGKSNETSGCIKADVKVLFVGGGGTSIKGKAGVNKSIATSRQTIEYNLSLAQDITEILKRNLFDQRIVLENFHYLSDEVQKKLAFDLRIFEDGNILFVILGIWREKNRLLQFNGDLTDRMIEIPVEPWKKEDFVRVINKGAKILNISFEYIMDDVIDASCNSIGVLQELCRNICQNKNIDYEQEKMIYFHMSDLEHAVDTKLEDYRGRQIRSLESFVTPLKTSSEQPLYLGYYFVIVMINLKYEDVISGIKRKELQNKINDIHQDYARIRSSDRSNFLHNIVKYQLSRSIEPPIFDYDLSTKTLKVIDSTFYFFLKHINEYELEDLVDAPF